jgi:hypothetical protein
VPRAVVYYRAYCFASAGLNLLLAAVSVWMIVRKEALASEWVPGSVWLLAGAMFLPTAVAFGLLNLWLSRVQRRPGHWAMHLGNICLGVASCCLTPLCLPLLLAWLRPEVKQWFGGD